MKQCCRCLLFKDFTKFDKSNKKSNRDGYRSSCKTCRKPDRAKERLTAKKYRDANPIRNKAKNLTRFWPGSTWQQAWEYYTNMLIEQNHKCKICKKPEISIDPKTKKVKALAVDHRHSDGKVRGLLCDRCNRGLGMLQDSIEICMEATNYLIMN